MFAQVQCPEILPAEQLDHYLEQGWFRMGQTIFTTNFLNFKSHLYSAIWLRIPLRDFSLDTTQKKLAKRNKRFRVEIQQAFITPEKEALFSAYRQSIHFEASASLRALLFGKSANNIYNTQEINVYNGNKLIAIGFFDLGKKSAAGISSFYDPAYKKYSLGKYLIYLKLEYCKNMAFEYFYPGYFVPGYPLFDYKLDIGKSVLQYLEFTSSRWKSIGEFSNTSTPLRIMEDKLTLLQRRLLEKGIQTQIMRYEFFDANLIPELEGIVLFDFPVFLYCYGLPGETPIVFDVLDNQYHWIKCKSVWASAAMGNPNEMYSTHVLKFDQDLLASNSPEVICSTVINELRMTGKFIRANSM